MANQKISALTALTSVATGDLIPIVDVSDTTDAATGTTKKIAYSDIVPVATTSVLGKTTMSVAPAVAVTPIAVGDNDGRVPTQLENNALVGNNTDIAVGTGNTFVTQTGLQHNAEKYAADAGANDTYVITLSPVPTSYTNGMVIHFKANTVNTGAATINVNSLGAKSIVKYVSTTLDDGDIAAGQLCTLIYDGTNFVLQNPIATVPTSALYAVNADETINSYFTYVVPMVPASASTMTGWTLTTSSGMSVTSVAGASTLVLSGGGTNFEALTLLDGTGAQTNYRYDDNKIIRIKMKLIVGDTTDRKGWGLVITNTNIHTAQSDTTNGEIRFILNGATLYAQNANGTATSTDISSGLTLTNWNLFEIVFTPGVNIKYYVNGTLKATHTTNLPTTGTPSLALGANTNGRTIRTMPPIISIQQ